MVKDLLTSSLPPTKRKRGGDGAQTYDNHNTSTRTNQDEIVSTELLLFDESWITRIIDLYRPWNPRIEEELPHVWKRKKISVSTTNQDEIVSTELLLFDESWITRNLDLCRPWNPRIEEALPHVRKRKNISVSTTTQDEIVSTELLLFDESWITRNLDLNRPWNPRNNDVFLEVAERRKVPDNLSRLIFQGGQGNPWKIKKKLQASDVGHMSRLLLGKEVVQNHILGYLTAEEVAEIHSNNGLKVTVCDVDTRSNADTNLYTMKLKYWESSKSYVMLNGWSREFVKRRVLTKEEEIGLYWKPYYRRFHFSVLSRAEAVTKN